MTAVSTASGGVRILDEAATLFLQRGYTGTSLRDIAAAAGMKAGSVYYHFSSKDQILEEVLRQGMDAVNAAFDSVAVTSHTTDLGRLTAHVTAHLDALFAHGAYTAAHVTMFHTVPDEVRRVIVPLRDAYESRWSSLLRELSPDATAGELRVARLMLIGAMNSTVEWFGDAGSATVDLAAEIARRFWEGFRP